MSAISAMRTFDDTPENFVVKPGWGRRSTRSGQHRRAGTPDVWSLRIVGTDVATPWELHIPEQKRGYPNQDLNRSDKPRYVMRCGQAKDRTARTWRTPSHPQQPWVAHRRFSVWQSATKPAL